MSSIPRCQSTYGEPCDVDAHKLESVLFDQIGHVLLKAGKHETNDAYLTLFSPAFWLVFINFHPFWNSQHRQLRPYLNTEHRRCTPLAHTVTFGVGRRPIPSGTEHLGARCSTAPSTESSERAPYQGAKVNTVCSME